MGVLVHVVGNNAMGSRQAVANNEMNIQLS